MLQSIHFPPAPPPEATVRLAETNRFPYDAAVLLLSPAGDPIMEASRLDQIREQLETELECAEVEVGRLKEELTAAERDHKAIKDALTALGKGRAPSPKKRTLKKADVEKAVREQLRVQPKPLPVEELDAALRDEFAGKGYSLTGFSLRLKEALKQDGVIATEQGVRLREAATAAS